MPYLESFSAYFLSGLHVENPKGIYAGQNLIKPVTIGTIPTTPHQLLK
jgi:hypothetical protein